MKPNVIAINVDEIIIPRTETNILSGEVYRIEKKGGKIVITCSEPNQRDYKLEYDNVDEAYEDYLFFIQNIGKTQEDILKEEEIVVRRYSQQSINQRAERFKEAKANRVEEAKYKGKNLFSLFS